MDKLNRNQDRLKDIGPLREKVTHAENEKLLDLLYARREKTSARPKYKRPASGQEKTVKHVITVLRMQREPENILRNAVTEKLVRDIREIHHSGQAIQESDIRRWIIAHANADTDYPPLDKFQATQASLAEFINVMDAPDQSDAKILQKHLFAGTSLAPATQRACIERMMEFVRDYSNASETTRLAMLETPGGQVEQFCIRWMDALDKGVPLSEMPGCGPAIHMIAKTISPPAPKQIPMPSARRPMAST